MDASGGCWVNCLNEEDLPLMDGTCDACEPDEPQPAGLVCPLCRFAFCVSHADKHSQSTHHQLQVYRPPDPQPDIEPLEHTQTSENRAKREEAAAGEDEDLTLPHGVRKRDTVMVERLKCKEHGQEGSLYCKEDEMIICVVCAVQGEHKEHEIITLKEAYLWQKVSKQMHKCKSYIVIDYISSSFSIFLQLILLEPFIIIVYLIKPIIWQRPLKVNVDLLRQR
ncbi:tripartite motif-containing protein 44 [Triplophysa rosa]|uniref:tripartite motif-containing protein 44 n=1 Tax=Triplophysa rosa TaxID=992332 RepID=UPI002545E880|nr:tripartite motif-containing protein 44 [Triplophysa rosa]